MTKLTLLLLFSCLLGQMAFAQQTDSRKQKEQITRPAQIDPNALGQVGNNSPKPLAPSSPCCLPVTQERNQDALFLEPVGTLNGEYRLITDLSGNYASILQAFIDYVGAVSPCATRLVTEWRLKNLTTGQSTVQWIYFDAGSNIAYNNPHTFNLPVTTNTPYLVSTYTYFEPKGCDEFKCSDRSSLIYFKIQVLPNARTTTPSLVIGNKPKNQVTIPLRKGKASLSQPKGRRNN